MLCYMLIRIYGQQRKGEQHHMLANKVSINRNVYLFELLVNGIQQTPMNYKLLPIHSLTLQNMAVRLHRTNTLYEIFKKIMGLGGCLSG